MSLKTTMLGLLAFFITPFLTAQSLEKILLFPSGDWELTASQHIELESLVAELKELDSLLIRLEGHTDDVGQEVDNLLLSRQRVENVQRALLALGVAPSAIEVDFYGESNPRSDNALATGKQANRRVRIMAHWTLSAPPPEPLALGDLEELFSGLQEPPQTFCIDPNRDTVLVGEQGTIVYVRAHSFVLEPGQRKRCVELALTEVYELADMLVHRLTTTSDGELLQSSGMFHIGASLAGKPVEIIQDLLVMSPQKYEGDSTLGVYDGVRVANGLMDWQRREEYLGRVPGNLFWECFQVDTTEVERCGFFFCQIRRFFRRIMGKKIVEKAVGTPSPCISIDERREDFEGKYQGFSAEQLKEIPQKDISYYVFSRRGGWANLDWLMKISEPATLFVQLEHHKEQEVRAIFPGQRSIVPLEAYGGGYGKRNLPEGYPVVVLALRFVKGLPQIATSRAIVGEEREQNFDFQTLGMEELKKRLKTLN